MESDGLETPESVRLATEAYHHSSDKVRLFAEDSLVKGSRYEVRTAEVFSTYKQWCIDNGYKVESATNFNAALSALVTIERKRPNTGGEKTTMIIGHKLVPEFNELAPLSG